MSHAFKERMICMETYQVRTDLAVEAKDMYIEKQGKSKDSVKGVTVKDRWENNIKISHVDITSEGSELINKKPGAYVTIYADGVKKQDTKKQKDAAVIRSEEHTSELQSRGHLV